MERIDRIFNNEKFKNYIRVIEEKETDRIYCRHGLDHLLDVARLAYIFSLEDKADVTKELIYAAALLHDIGRADVDDEGIDHHKLSCRYAVDIIREAGFDKCEENEIIKAISLHNSSNKKKKGLSLYIYRADKLSRDCYNCKAIDTCYWKPEEKNMNIEY
ncbi:HD domain-containing protein [Coprococcus sp. OM04-5BH]|jgi:uncharacterized protein|uniref:HD domain-containing protein n=1 Tax=Coprococcus sp. OM04-5BH TaxID=2293093 RepID=UPI000E4BEE77|nr:HD domain-containing protein [Coprococcus sp. OM04-5BH]RHV31485.1 HD domain-containing protein [Coprococcus sp. OM04-5BH]